MKTKIRVFPGVLALVVFGLYGQANGGEASNEPTEQPQPPAMGKVAILENDRIMEGDIERVGDQYRVRRSIGETWLPGDKVRHLCANLEEALTYLRSQANLNDPDERLRLARWCQLHNLSSQALAEATAAVALRPDHRESQRLVRAMQRSCAAEPSLPRPNDEPDTAAVTNIPYNPEALGPFVTKVQPILMNTCASCHASGKGGSFKLVRGYDEGISTNRRTTQQNLMATLAQLNENNPQQSRLLTFALMVHGAGDKPPLKGRNTPAFRILEDWAQQALSHTTRPMPAAQPLKSNVPADWKVVADQVSKAPRQAATPAAAEDATNWKPRAEAAAKESAELAAPTSDEQGSADDFATSKPPAKPSSSPPAASAPKQSEPADPFDPVIFNQQK
jgi:hypothetical protein